MGRSTRRCPLIVEFWDTLYIERERVESESHITGNKQYYVTKCCDKSQILEEQMRIVSCVNFDAVVNYSSIPIYDDGLKLTGKRINADIEAVKVWELKEKGALNLKFVPRLKPYLTEAALAALPVIVRLVTILTAALVPRLLPLKRKKTLMSQWIGKLKLNYLPERYMIKLGLNGPALKMGHRRKTGLIYAPAVSGSRATRYITGRR
ncbi:hypothetical protein EVAR_45938_1 [Eumeta japonica]|uniref:Uncharacterized protein n=1 Tax=Eumeta variegata TaxID=151549 RepID=A0A4C1W5B7_EUMVA|nr:hypothetical protein EVAR_45938_1 [Eumeta japonica]